MECAVKWQDIKDRIQLPEAFPLPPDDGEVKGFLTWEDVENAGQTTTQIVFRLSLDFTDPDRLWEFIKFPYKPQVRHFQLQFETRYNDAQALQTAAATGPFQGNLSAKIDVQLPELPPMPMRDLVHIHTGDAAGWMTISIMLSEGSTSTTGGKTLTTGDSPSTALEISIEHPVSFDLDLPKLPQPAPPIHLDLDKISLNMNENSTASGKITVAGSFVLKPLTDFPVEIPFAAQLEQLLAPISDYTHLKGTASLELAFANNRARLHMISTFTDTSIGIDLLQMLTSLTRNFPSPDIQQPQSIPLDAEMEFGLKGVEFTLGSLDATSSTAEEASIKLKTSIRVGSLVTADGSFALSDKQVSVGFEDIEIPLFLPRFPLSRSALQAGGGQSDLDWQIHIAGFETRAADLQHDIDNLQAELDASAAGAASNQRTQGQIKDDLKSKKQALSDLEGQILLLKEILRFRSPLSTQNSKARYDTWIGKIVDVLEFTRSGNGGMPYISSDGTLKYNTPGKLKLKLNKILFAFKYNAPRDIHVEGSAGFVGFSDDDPLKALEGVTLSLGISADLIYFSLDTPGQAIPVPGFGRYEGGSVTIGRALFGFGYTKRSLAVEFNGELVLPPQLRADIDTSQRFGAGVRLPSHTKLNFRFELIPVPFIKILPYFEFKLDLRDNVSLGIASAQGCQPYWDGLEFHAPGILELAFKSLAVSPMFGPLVAPIIHLLSIEWWVMKKMDCLKSLIIISIFHASLF